MTNDPLERAHLLLTEVYSMFERVLKVPPVHVKPNNRPKLTKGDVKRVFIMRRNGCTITDIAECFDVNKSTISRTLRGVYH